MSRFHSIIQADRGAEYDLVFTASPSQNFRFELHSQSKTAGVTIRIPYPSAVSRSVLVDDKAVEMNQWDESLQQYGEIK